MARSLRPGLCVEVVERGHRRPKVAAGVDPAAAAAQELAEPQFGPSTLEGSVGPPVVLEAPLVVGDRVIRRSEKGLACATRAPAQGAPVVSANLTSGDSHSPAWSS